MSNFSNAVIPQAMLKLIEALRDSNTSRLLKFVIVNIQKNHRHFIKLESSDRPLPINDIISLDSFDLLSL